MPPSCRPSRANAALALQACHLEPTAKPSRLSGGTLPQFAERSASLPQNSRPRMRPARNNSCWLLSTVKLCTRWSAISSPSQRAFTNRGFPSILPFSTSCSGLRECLRTGSAAPKSRLELWSSANSSKGNATSRHGLRGDHPWTRYSTDKKSFLKRLACRPLSELKSYYSLSNEPKLQGTAGGDLGWSLATPKMQSSSSYAPETTKLKPGSSFNAIFAITRPSLGKREGSFTPCPSSRRNRTTKLKSEPGPGTYWKHIAKEESFISDRTSLGLMNC